MDKHVSKLVKHLLLYLIFFSPQVFSDNISSYNVNITLINKITLPGSQQDIQIIDDNAYILTGGIVIKYDISDPPIPKNPITYPVNTSSMAFSNRYGYFTTGNNLKVYDLTTDTPVEKNSLVMAGNIIKMSVSNGYLLLLKPDQGLIVYDIKNPETPILKGTQFVPGEANSMFIKDKTAYITCRNAYLSIIDFSDPVKLPIIGSYNAGVNFYDVYVQDNYAFLSQGVTGVQVVDIKKSSIPQHITNIFTRKFSKQIVLSNYYAWLNDENTIQAFYNKDPESFLFAGQYDNEGAVINRIAVIDGKYILVCSSDGLLKVLKIQYFY